MFMDSRSFFRTNVISEGIYQSTKYRETLQAVILRTAVGYTGFPVVMFYRTQAEALAAGSIIEGCYFTGNRTGVPGIGRVTTETIIVEGDIQQPIVTIGRQECATGITHNRSYPVTACSLI